MDSKNIPKKSLKFNTAASRHSKFSNISYQFLNIPVLSLPVVSLPKDLSAIR
jgi:hypothetical protein